MKVNSPKDCRNQVGEIKLGICRMTTSKWTMRSTAMKVNLLKNCHVGSGYPKGDMYLYVIIFVRQGT